VKAWRCAALLAALAATPAFALEFEPSVRYWISEGRTTWNHNAQPANPGFGNPTSQLTYSGMKSGVLEFGLTVRFGEFFGAAAIGAGAIDGGTLRDEDWFVGQVKFSDTDSVIKGDALNYWMLDFGRNLAWNERGLLAVFIGYGQYHEIIEAFGATDNLANGAVLVPSSVKVITNDAKWTFVRLGLNGKVRLGQRFTFLGEIAYAALDLRNEDSHHLRNDLGPVPNIHMRGTGNGVMWQLEGRVALFKGASLSLAYRDWRFKADGTISFGASGRSLPLNAFETTRSGARVGFNYVF
jgi:hypothetical protein